MIVQHSAAVFSTSVSIRLLLLQSAFGPPVVMARHLTQNTLGKTGAVSVTFKCNRQPDEEDSAPGPQLVKALYYKSVVDKGRKYIWT